MNGRNNNIEFVADSFLLLTYSTCDVYLTYNLCISVRMRVNVVMCLLVFVVIKLLIFNHFDSSQNICWPTILVRCV